MGGVQLRSEMDFFLLKVACARGEKVVNVYNVIQCRTKGYFMWKKI